MTQIVTSIGAGESKRARAIRLQRSADIFRAVADDAVAENQRAYDRAVEAVAQAEYAEREAELAWRAVNAEEAEAWSRSSVKSGRKPA